ncbi:hypothetical protein [Paeniglutamicibacter terrestris]|uniref:Uncharacterized protein n=1 Tax=Paeniglutamicibacter terrestris TaxID=2723403 RepID=A0ABX1G2S0_9MICC|nr:hypothetical protein [Paeniglutamicibacter terrestris]NKG19965.1 hypothetical protein [Paeniglutamicibacter terrestris]
MSVVAVVAIVIVGWLLVGAILAFALGRTVQLREKYETPTAGVRDIAHEKDLRVTGGSGIDRDNVVYVGASEQKRCS